MSNRTEQTEPQVLTLDEVALSPATWLRLRRAGFETLGDLSRYSRAQLQQLRGVGDATLDEIERVLQEHSLALSETGTGQVSPVVENWAHGLRPMRVLADFNRRYPNAWKQIARFRMAPPDGQQWPDWCYCPVTGVLNAVLPEKKSLHEALREHPIETTRDLSGLAALSAWRLTKGIYRFHPTTLEHVWDTPLQGDLPVELLYKLPEWCLYVEVGRELPAANGPITLHGFWAQLMWFEEKAELWLLMDMTQNGEDKIGPVPVPLRHGTLAENVLAAAQRTREAMRDNGMTFGYNDEQIAASTQDTGAPLISLLLYICSAVPDTPARDVIDAAQANRLPARPTAQRSTLPAAVEPSWWRVGYRMGQALRGALAHAARQHEFANRDRNEGSTVAPHVRRAHWHLYWTGEGSRSDESKRVPALKWLPPVPVNVKDFDALPATVRPVR